MSKELLSSRQAISLLILFIFGSSVVFGVSSGVGQDSWISLIFSIIILCPIIFIYARIMKLYPENDIYEIIEKIFGKFISKIIILMITWYAIHLASLVVRNFSEFIQIVAMPETPQLPLMIIMIIVTVYLARCGIQVLGKWSLLTLSIVLFTVLVTVFASLNIFNFSNILPIMEHSMKDIASDSFKIFAFPFAETILFLTLAGSIKKELSPYKIYYFGILSGFAILLIIILRNILTLGAATVENEYFPSYSSARIIDIGNFITRIESSISMNFILAGITKITVCLLAAAKGMARLFDIEDYKRILLPVSLSVLTLAAILYKNIMEMFNFINFYKFYAIPFQILIPVIIWICAEVKKHKDHVILT